MSPAFCPYASLPQSINSSTFNHTVLTAHESPEWGNTVQKCLITAAFQIKWRRCIIHLWRIPGEWGSAGKTGSVWGFPSASHLAIGWCTQFCNWDPGEAMLHSPTWIIGWPFHIRCSLFIPDNNIFSVSTHNCFFSSQFQYNILKKRCPSSESGSCSSLHF